MTDDDHRELASEAVDGSSLLMAWSVLLANGMRVVELGVWGVPPDFDLAEPELIGPSAPLRFTERSLPPALLLARTAAAKLPSAGLPRKMPRGSCARVASVGPLQALACRDAAGADRLVLAWEDGSAAAHVPVAKAAVLAKVLAAAQEALSGPGSARPN